MGSEHSEDASGGGLFPPVFGAELAKSARKCLWK